MAATCILIPQRKRPLSHGLRQEELSIPEAPTKRRRISLLQNLRENSRSESANEGVYDGARDSDNSAYEPGTSSEDERQEEVEEEVQEGVLSSSVEETDKSDTDGNLTGGHRGDALKSTKGTRTRGKFTCPHPGCGRNFPKAAKLERHERSHTGVRHLKSHLTPKPYKCTVPYCTSAFAKHSQLRKHMLEDHPSNDSVLIPNPYLCDHPGCGKGFKTKQKLKQHLMVHSETPRYQCGHDSCNLAFPKWTALRKHIKEAHPPTCVHCGKTFTRREGLRNHYKTSGHNLLVAMENANASRTASTESESEAGATSASETHGANGIFGSARDTRDQDDVDTVTDVHDLNPSPAAGSPNGPTSPQFTRRTFPCTEPGCTKSFMSAKSRTVHIRSVHEGLRPHVCTTEGCGARFAHKHLLVRHRRLHQRQEEASGASGAEDNAGTRKGKKKAGDVITGIAEGSVGLVSSNDAHEMRQLKQVLQTRSTTSAPTSSTTTPSGSSRTGTPVNVAAIFTGATYSPYATATGRTIPCPVDPTTCHQRFAREWDAVRHANIVHHVPLIEDGRAVWLGKGVAVELDDVSVGEELEELDGGSGNE
ncbi:Strongly-conserved Zn-finger binding protein (TFIIIA) [Quaeritorhiza haematococci]|nr:Strongly-conserved Zn-finger binding protein (TFIIIA) [Quaeritorhiza haematococci]